MTKEEYQNISLADFVQKLDYLDRMALAKEKNPEEYKREILGRVYDLIVESWEKEVNHGK